MSDNSGMDRRSYLKYAGAATMTAMAGCGGGGDGGDEANHEVPHPEDDTVPESERTAQALNGQSRPETVNQGKDGVGYSHTPSDDQNCGNCALYVPDQNDDGFGACTAVAGKIHPCDYCDLWSSYDGDDAVPCES